MITNWIFSKYGLKYELFSTSVHLQRVVALNHRVCMTLLNEWFWHSFVLVFIWMKFPFHWPCTPTALPHRLKFSKLIQWMTFSQQVSSYNEWLPSVTEWVWIYWISVFGLTLVFIWMNFLIDWTLLFDYPHLHIHSQKTWFSSLVILIIWDKKRVFCNYSKGGDQNFLQRGTYSLENLTGYTQCRLPLTVKSWVV